MHDLEKLCELIHEELNKIADKGLTTGNLDTAYKLIDMYKDIKNTEYWETKGDYYAQQTGYSEARKRDSKGRYSRDGAHIYDGIYRGRRDMMPRGTSYRGDERSDYDPYEEYMDMKRSYRSDKSSDCKKRMMQSLEDYMEDFAKHIEDMSRDADCAEERQMINEYLRKIREFK